MLDPDMLLVCEGCATDLTVRIIEASEFRCPHCGGARFQAPLRGLDDVDALVSAGATIMVGTHIALTWAVIAIEAALRARAAPQHDYEFGESLLACTAAAHAVDAFYGGFSRYAQKPKTLAKESSRNQWVLETAKAVFKLDNRTVSHHSTELQWLYRMRDDAVHFGEELQGPAEHHTGVVTAAEVAKWSSPSATRAVTEMLSFMGDCIEHPREGAQLATWLKTVMAPQVTLFRQRWGAAQSTGGAT